MISNDLLIEPDLQIENGDLKIGPSDDNNTLYIIYAQKGQLRAAPRLGVGILSYINAPTNRGRELARAIRQEHNRDGYKVSTLQVETSTDGKQNLSVKATKVRL